MWGFFRPLKGLSPALQLILTFFAIRFLIDSLSDKNIYVIVSVHPTNVQVSSPRNVKLESSNEMFWKFHHLCRGRLLEKSRRWRSEFVYFLIFFLNINAFFIRYSKVEQIKLAGRYSTSGSSKSYLRFQAMVILRPSIPGVVWGCDWPFFGRECVMKKSDVNAWFAKKLRREGMIGENNSVAKPLPITKKISSLWTFGARLY